MSTSTIVGAVRKDETMGAKNARIRGNRSARSAKRSASMRPLRAAERTPPAAF